MDVVDVTEQLMAEFEDRLGLEVISRVVNGCRRDLDCISALALPEMLERLARQRLLDVLTLSLSPVPTGPSRRVLRLP